MTATLPLNQRLGRHLLILVQYHGYSAKPDTSSKMRWAGSGRSRNQRCGNNVDAALIPLRGKAFVHLCIGSVFFGNPPALLRLLGYVS